MKEKFQFREAQISDAETIQRLVNSAYRGDSSRKGWTTEADLLAGQRTDAQSIRDLIQKKDSKILLLEDSTELAKGILASVHLEKTKAANCYFGMFTVSPHLQGRGIGKKLMSYAETYAKNTWNCPAMEMTVISLREELMNFYIRHGYEKTDQWVDFPYGDEKFGLPLRPDLKMIVLRKSL